MAQIVLDGDDLVVALTPFEQAQSLRHGVRVPRVSVRAAEVVDEPVGLVAGLKLPGARLPGVFAVGTLFDRGRRRFVVVHHGTPRGVRIELEGARFDELLVGCDEPDEVVAAVLAPRG